MSNTAINSEMTDDELEAIKARVSAATPGPWTTADIDGIGPFYTYDFEPLELDEDDPDVDFVSHAVEDVQTLITEVERLRAKLSYLYDSGAVKSMNKEALNDNCS